uniref:Phospholipase A2 receptor 1 n=1 Tax=Maylandia zebra TaxID=106582 RepID=A0A3P9BBN9_9CICH
KGLFILESEPLKQCISANRSKLVLEDCERPTRRMLWKWVSQHRLFNLGTSACLGLNISDSTQPLGMFECDVSLPVLWWRCSGNTLYGASQWRVTVVRGLVAVKKNIYHQWKRYNTPREGPCSYPYEIHTLLGNAHGMPCAFPFKYNNQWYSECTTEGREDHLLWCSATSRYDKGERWGFCPVQSGCEHFWESNQELRACYQFNLYTIQTWSQALSTCQAQGGNLLSITSLAEHKYIRMVWTGLNHIKDGHGWGWSDGAPLSLVNFTTLPASPLQDNKQCGVYSGFEGHWQSLSCESALPYICKKTPNDTRGAEPLNWQYIDTECADGWWPHNGFCYRVLPEAEAGSWEESSQECHSYGANLTSIHSLSEVEMLVNLLANGWKKHGHSCYMVTGQEQSYEDALMGYYCKGSLLTVENFEQAFVNSLLSESGAKSSMYYWIGLRDQDQGRKGEYRWLHHNGSSLPLTFTNWNKHQPSTGGCVAMSGGPALGRWEVKDCKVHKALAVCKQNIRSYHDVQLPEHHIDAYAPCPPGWESNSGLLHCFKVFHSEKVLMKRSWVEADFFCQALGAQLASFQHYEEQVFVKQLLSTMFETEVRRFWVGLNKRDPEYAGAWEWSDGSPVVMSFIDDKSEEDDRRDCAAYSDLTNTFMPQLCDSKHEWIDKLNKPYWYTESEPWVFYRGAEYLLAKQPFDWQAVSLACQMMGAYLLSIHSKEELNFVKEKWALSRCSDLHGYVCKRETVSVVETPREPHYIGRCPEKWLYFGHKCLLLHLPTSPKEGKSWKDAQSICSSFQGSLVAIEDEIEQFITMFLQGSAVGVWIGLRDEDTMKWTNGRPVSYTNWDEPLCTVLSNNHNFHLTGKWYDEKCSESGYGFVCQKPQPSKRPTHSYHHLLPEIIEYRNRNYKVVTGNLSWYDAMNKCKGHDSDLVSITDAYHQAFLTFLVNRLGAPHWIGLYSVDSGINYQWSDGSDTVYTHWDAADDDDDFETGECVYMDVNGGWRRADCETLLPGALCHVPQSPSKPNTSDVLTIEDETENRFIMEQLWSSRLLPQTLWLGMHFNVDDSMAWVDGSPMEYTNWPHKGPNPKLLTEDSCVTTRVVDGTWHFTPCTERLGFICKIISLHHGVIPAAVLAALLIFILLAGVMWFLYKRSSGRFQRLPTLGSAYFRQTDSQATESDGNVLIADLEPPSGE